MANNYIAKLKLSNYLNSRVIEVENDDGIMEKGIFIPIDMNGLVLTPRNQVISWLFVNEKLHDTGDGYSHYLRIKTDIDHVKSIKDMGYDVPYMGNMKSSFFTTQYHKKMETLTDKRVKNIDYDE